MGGRVAAAFTGAPWSGAKRRFYLLRSLKDGNVYTGYTADLRSRVAAHSAGKVRATCDRRPLHLIYYEAYLLPKDARAREIFLKSGSGERYIRKQMSHYFSASKA